MRDRAVQMHDRAITRVAHIQYRTGRAREVAINIDILASQDLCVGIRGHVIADTQQDRADRRIDQAVGHMLGRVFEEQHIAGGQQIEVFALRRALPHREADVAA